MRLDLARQITIGLLVYGVLLSIALFAHGLLVNERAERRIWEAMLDTSMTDLLERRHHDPRFHGWIEARGYATVKTLRTYDIDVRHEYPALIQRIIAVFKTFIQLRTALIQRCHLLTQTLDRLRHCIDLCAQ